MSLLNAFIDHLINFLDDLKLTFPELIDIQTAHQQLDIWGDNSSVKLMAIQSFMTCCSPYYMQIFSEEEKFFTDEKNIEKAEGFKKYGGDDAQKQEESMAKILQFRDYWHELSDTSKAKIWINMKALVIKGAGALMKLEKDPGKVRTYENIIRYAKKHPEIFTRK